MLIAFSTSHLRRATAGLKALERNFDQVCPEVAKLRAQTLDRMSLSEVLPCLESMSSHFDATVEALESYLAAFGYVPYGE